MGRLERGGSGRTDSVKGSRDGLSGFRGRFGFHNAEVLGGHGEKGLVEIVSRSKERLLRKPISESPEAIEARVRGYERYYASGGLRVEQGKEIPKSKFVNLDSRNIPLVRGAIKQYKEDFKSVLSEVIVPREEVDERILADEYRIHAVNTERARRYGQTYEPPDVLYVDVGKYADHASEMSSSFRKNEIEPPDLSVSFFSHEGNIAFIYVNAFDDPDIAAYETVKTLRHELLGHGGELKLYSVFQESDGLKVGPVKAGGRVLGSNGEYLGSVLSEAHVTIQQGPERRGRVSEIVAKDPILSQLRPVDDIFPGTQEKYERLKWLMVGAGRMESGESLTHQRSLENNRTMFGRGMGVYQGRISLMETIYSNHPELYELANGFIYGGKTNPFATRLNHLYGPNFFRTLMSATNDEQAVAILQEMERRGLVDLA